MSDVVLINIEEEVTQQTINKLAPYVAMTKRLTHVVDGQTLNALQALVDALIETGKLVAQVSFQAKQAKSERKKAEGIALLERFPEYVKDRKIKGTVAEAEAFVKIDKDVIAAQRQEDYFTALYEYVTSAKDGIQNAHDDLKKDKYSSTDTYKDKSKMLA